MAGRPSKRIELEKLMGVDVVFRRPPAPIPESEPTEDTAETDENVEAALADVRAEVMACTKCPLHETRKQGVFSRGRHDARLMIIGEAPGADEDATGEPFVGRAGKLLDQMILAMGLERDDAYITNILKSRPPGNRDPKPNEIEACWPYLERQIDLIHPEVIMTLGKPASNTLLDTNESMGRLRGVWREFRGIPLMCTYHPAYLLRSPGQKAKAWQDLKQVIAKLSGLD